MSAPTLAELQALVDADGIVLGAAPAAPYDEAEAALADRVERGLWADMRFTAARPEVSCHPERAVRGAQTVVSAILPVWEPATERPAGPVGRLPRYAWGDPYGVLRDALGRVRAHLAADGFRSVVHVDANHHVDREGARRAGLTFTGKSTMAIAPGLGTFIAIGTLITDAAIGHAPPDPVRQGCGDCTLCIDACPTGALDEAYVLDAEACVSYWTQSRREVPDAVAEGFDDMVYGCDVCQDVCPYNHGPIARRTERAPSAAGWVRLDAWLEASEEDLVNRYARLYVPDLDGRYLKRNALIALGNGPAEHRELARPFAEGEDPVLGPAARRELGA
ncbi:MAG: epoxyqueuosine reductase [Actinomycetota bacterium]